MLPLLADGAAAAPLRAVVIGHTGAGNYGHDLDAALAGVPGVEVVGIADRDPAGRAKAARRAGALREYGDYREMLAREKPQLVVVAPRWSEEHHAMARQALDAGAHVLTEKPFTVTLAEADDLLGLAKQKNLKIAVSHQMRLAPSITHFQRALAGGLIGDLVEIRAWGKQDARAGGEDMLVLGTHIFDMMRLLAGDALWCSATVQSRGHEITRADARRVAEGIGPVAGDEIEAEFGFGNGVHATFTSRGRLRNTLGHWGMELLGSKGEARIFMDIFPVVLLRKPALWKPSGVADEWVPVPGDPTTGFTDEQRGFGPANRRVVDDWLAAIRENREPQCSGANATRALEMVMAVYEAALNKSRVALPLQMRKHPLE